MKGQGRLGHDARWGAAVVVVTGADLTDLHHGRAPARVELAAL